MESGKLAMCESLINWFKMLNLTAPHSNVMELSDGVALAQALHQIASDSFDGNKLPYKIYYQSERCEYIIKNFLLFLCV